MLPNFILDNIGLSVAVLIVVVGLLVIGLGDLLRFSPTRVWAIGGVSFRQSIRRRVLWITPLVIVGVIIVSQLQKAVDAQDAIRQTTMFCLFATGMLVVLVTIILACTNLPREIESRVIYTVATKPTTRLEIVLGKVVGFVRVSFWILVIMGLFTYGYVTFRDWRMRSYLADQLDTPGAVEPVNRPTLEYYRDHGTLHARVMDTPESLHIMAHLPTNRDDRWVPGMGEGEIWAAIELDRSMIPAPDPQAAAAAAAPSTVGPSAAPPKGGIVLQVAVRVEPSGETPMFPEVVPPTTAPATAPAITGPTTAPAAAAAAPTTRPALQTPKVAIFINSDRREVAISPPDLGGAVDGWDVQEGINRFQFYITPDQLARALPPHAERGLVYVTMTGQTDGWKYSSDESAIALIVPETEAVFRPLGELEFTGRLGQYGRQLRGGRGTQRVAMYRFDRTGVAGAGGERDAYQFELRLGVERLEEDEATKMAVHVHNQKGRTFSKDLFVETNRPIYIDVPAEAIEGEMFWVLLQSESNSWIGLSSGPRASLRLVEQDQSFAWNLLKSLGVLWLMSILVTIVSIFTSTFLSWPIAVVLTVMILSGRWAAEMIGAAEGSVGRQVVTEMFGRDAGAAGARAVSESVDALVMMLHTVSQFLPDLSQFRAIEDLEQGIAISPAEVLVPSLLVTVGFGVPLMVLGYVFLKFKEVAP